REPPSSWKPAGAPTHVARARIGISHSPKRRIVVACLLSTAVGKEQKFALPELQSTAAAHLRVPAAGERGQISRESSLPDVAGRYSMNHAADRVATVEQRRWPANNFDVIHCQQIDGLNFIGRLRSDAACP